MSRIASTAVRFLSFVMLAALLAPDAGALPPAPVLWVDASTLATGANIDAATTPVSNLGSQGGSFNVGTYDVEASGIGNLNTLKFNGANQYLKSMNAYSNSGTELTMFMVQQRITDKGEYSGSLAGTFPGTKDFQDVKNFTYHQGGGTMYGERTNSLPSIAHPGNGVPFIGTMKFDNVNCTHYQKTSSASSSNSVANSGTFGCTQTALAARLAADPDGAIGNYNNVNIGEVLIYNSALSTTDREAVEAYLAVKWGISAGIPGGPPWIPAEGTALIVR